MIGKEEDYTTGSLLDFNYFDKHYKLVAVDLSKQKEIDADLRAIQQTEFKRNYIRILQRNCQSILNQIILAAYK